MLIERARLLSGRSALDIEQGAQILARGDLLAFATETVYGLGARADDDTAVARIFQAKGRPAWHPLIVHITDAGVVTQFASHVPSWATRLMALFWPGPLTLILPRKPGVADAAAAQAASIGLRCPQHAVAQALLQQARLKGVSGVAAPSANRFGRISPTLAEHVVSEFVGTVPVLDGGACTVGIESTIVDCTQTAPALLRPGMLSLAQLEQALDMRFQVANKTTPKVSGSLDAHYAPRARLRLLPRATILAAQAAPALHKVAVYLLPEQIEAAAHDLFAQLRILDQNDIEEIWVSEVPTGQAWDGVRDRLQRAAFDRAATTPMPR